MRHFIKKKNQVARIHFRIVLFLHLVKNYTFEKQLELWKNHLFSKEIHQLISGMQFSISTKNFLFNIFLIYLYSFFSFFFHEQQMTCTIKLHISTSFFDVCPIQIRERDKNRDPIFSPICAQTLSLFLCINKPVSQMTNFNRPISNFVLILNKFFEFFSF